MDSANSCISSCSVDCGTTSFEPLAVARKLGTDVIVIDHHQADEKLPDVAAVVNPNRQDDISGLGQTRAALKLTPNLPDDKKRYYMAEGAGHYGIFNGSRWRSMILPEIASFIREHDRV